MSDHGHGHGLVVMVMACRLPDGLMKLVNLTQLSLNDSSVSALPQDIGRSLYC